MNPTYAGDLKLLPGIDPSVVVQSSNPGVGTIAHSPARLDQGGYDGVFVEFQPVGLGDANVTAIPLAGFTVPVERSAIENGNVRFHVTLPEWEIEPPRPLGKDTERQMSLALARNVQTFSTNVPVTIRSSDPSKILLSTDPATPGSDAISMRVNAGTRWTDSFYVQAINNQGSAQLVITAPGLADTYYTIPLTDTLFGFDIPSQPLRVVLQGGPVTGRIFVATANGDNGGIRVRPGATMTVHMDSSDPSVLAVDTPDLTFAVAASLAEFAMRPVRTGQATISLVPPPGFGVFPVSTYGLTSAFKVSVEPVRLNINVFSSLGKDQQMPVSVGTEQLPQPANIAFTVTSNDPSRLVVSNSRTSPGTVQATLSGSRGDFYLQALANSGEVTVTVSSPNAQSATATVRLAPSGVIFVGPGSALTLPVNGYTVRYSLGLARLDPATMQPQCCGEARPGWNGTVTVTSTNPAVAAVSPSTIQMSSSDTQYVEIKPGTAGTARITLSGPPGSDTPASDREIVVTVR